MALVVTLFVGGACEPHVPPQAPPASSSRQAAERTDTGSIPVLPDAEGSGISARSPVAEETVVARLGEDVVTWADVERAIRRRALREGVPVARLAPPGWERDPRLLWTIADEILQERQLLREGERLGLTSDLDQLLAAWRGHPDLGVYLEDDLDAVEARLQSVVGLGVSDIYDLLRVEIVRRRWVERVLAGITADRLWSEYEWRNRTVVVDVVAIPNVPSNRELAAFMETPAEARFIESEYEAHPNRYTMRPSADVRAVRVTVAEGASAAEVEAARRQIEQLRAEVLDGANMVTMSIEWPDGLAVRSGGLHQRVVARQLPGIFDQPVGEVGPIQRDSRGFAFYRLERRYPATLRPLDEILRREIASNRLTRLRILSSARETGLAVLDAMRAGEEAGLEEVVRERSLRRTTLGPFRHEEDGLIPGMGRSVEAAEAIFALSSPGDVVAEPLLVDATVYVVRLVERTDPTRADFAADRESFESWYRQLIRSTAWDAFWAQRRQEQPFELILGGD